MASNERNRPRSDISTMAGDPTRRTMHSCCTRPSADKSYLQGTVGVKIQDCLKKGRRPNGVLSCNSCSGAHIESVTYRYRNGLDVPIPTRSTNHYQSNLTLIPQCQIWKCWTSSWDLK